MIHYLWSLKYFEAFYSLKVINIIYTSSSHVNIENQIDYLFSNYFAIYKYNINFYSQN